MAKGSRKWVLTHAAPNGAKEVEVDKVKGNRASAVKRANTLTEKTGRKVYVEPKDTQVR